MPKHSRIPSALVAVAALAALILVVVAPASGAKSAAVQLGESSPVLSNPNQQAIAHGEDLAAQAGGLDRQAPRREPVPEQAGLRRRHLHQPGREGDHHLDAGSGHGRRRVQARARREHPDRRLRVDLERHLDRLRRARVRLQHGPEGREVHQQPDSAREGARGRRAAGAVDHELHQLLHQEREVAGHDRARGAEERQRHRRDGAADRAVDADEVPGHADAIWCYNDPSALGAGAVVKSAGKTVWSGSKKGIIIEGANGSADAAAGIKQGVITRHVGSAGGPDGPPVGRAAGDEAEEPERRPSSSSCPMKVWDASNIASYVDPLKRTVKLGTIPSDLDHQEGLTA